MNKRVGYAKIGRSWNLDPNKATSVGGDIDVINALKRLALAHPTTTFVLVGKNSGENPQDVGYPPNIENPWTEWKKEWKTATDPKLADMAIENFRRIAGNHHETIDAMIVWAGQHGSANSRIPMIGSNWITPPGQELVNYDVASGNEYSNAQNDIITGGDGEDLATPQFSFIHYVSWLLDYIGRWREAGGGPTEREEIWLCPDPRNYLKCREMRWPTRYPVLAQYDFLKYQKHERYGRFPEELFELDPTGYRENSLWVSNRAYCHSGLELTAVGDPDQLKFDPMPGAHKFGMVVNENLTGVKDSRLELVKRWVIPHFPDAEIRGHWTEKSQIELGRVINPAPYTEAMATMKSFATTLTTPASGSEWATAKPWEAFAIGSICFFHPRYDAQGHIIPKDTVIDRKNWDADARMLGSYLRVTSAEQLAERVNEVTSNPDLYKAIVEAQRRHYERSFIEWAGGTKAITDRLNQELGGEFDSNEPWTKRTEPPAAQVQGRAAARPRGTNAERIKKKPPISRRRAARDSAFVEATQEVVAPVEAVVETTVVASVPDLDPATDIDTKTVADCATKFNDGATFRGTLSDWKSAGIGPSTYVQGGAIPSREFTIRPRLEFAVTPKAGPRTSKDEYFVKMAEHVATQTTCARRAVGCVLVNKHKEVVATGYNGVPKGTPHCNEGHPCKGVGMPSGEGLGECKSAHAEINGVMQCANVHEIETVYLTVSPCRECIKALMNTGATRIVFRDEYPHPESKELWLSRPGNQWVKL